MQAEWPKRTSSCAGDRLVSRVIGELMRARPAPGRPSGCNPSLQVRRPTFCWYSAKVEPCPLPAKCEFAGKFAKKQREASPISGKQSLQDKELRQNLPKRGAGRRSRHCRERHGDVARERQGEPRTLTKPCTLQSKEPTRTGELRWPPMLSLFYRPPSPKSLARF